MHGNDHMPHFQISHVHVVFAPPSSTRSECVCSLGLEFRRGAGVLDMVFESPFQLLTCGYDTFIRLWDLRLSPRYSTMVVPRRVCLLNSDTYSVSAVQSSRPLPHHDQLQIFHKGHLLWEFGVSTLDIGGNLRPTTAIKPNCNNIFDEKHSKVGRMSLMF